MYKLHEQVDVFHQNEHLGKGTITDICQTKTCVERYFCNDHPFFAFYMKTIQKKEAVYIVNFEYDLGQGGYVKEQVRKRINRK